MENLQDILTLAATVVEYVFFAYLAIAFMVYSLKSPSTARSASTAPMPYTTWEPIVPSSVQAASVPYKPWEPTTQPGASLTGMA